MRLSELLGIITRRGQRFLRQEAARSSARPFQQLRTLWVIFHEPGFTQAALAERICVDAPAASRLVDRLVKDRLLERRPGPDRRAVHLYVTRTARKEVAIVDAAIDALDRERIAALGKPDARLLLRLLGKLHAADDK
jgi:DNA-binding MarR family transcriptional regulator